MSEPTLLIEKSERIATFMRGVFSWMAGGLVVTALVAGAVASSPEAINLIVN